MDPKFTRREILATLIAGGTGAAIAPAITEAHRDPKAPPPTEEEIKRDRVVGGVFLGGLVLGISSAVKGRFRQDTSASPDLHRKREQDRRDAIRDAQERHHERD